MPACPCIICGEPRIIGDPRGWPERKLPFNVVQRLTGGLRALVSAASRPAAPAHETAADGRLCLSLEMPLLGHRFRYMHTLSESELSQVICAADTYRHCAPSAEGRTTPLVPPDVDPGLLGRFLDLRA